MPSPELAAQLADLGWAALFLFLVLGIGYGLHRRWWVPGWVYREERDHRLRLESQVERNIRALEAIARKGTASDRRPFSSRDDATSPHG